DALVPASTQASTVGYGRWRKSRAGTPFARCRPGAPKALKTMQKPLRPIQYLLRADPRLRRISLRRISVRVKKRISVRVKNMKKPLRSFRLKGRARTKKSTRFPWLINARAIVLVVICAMAAAVLIAARQPVQRAGAASVDAQPDAHARQEKMAAAERPETKKTVASKAPAAAVGGKKRAAEGTTGNTQAVATTTGLESEPAAKAPAVESEVKADVQNSAPVTITGCLALDAGTFWLKNTSGTDLPKSRSWKSGFLKKHSSPIELVDAANSLKLSNYVGQRVAATGPLMNREMGARSLQRVAASCS